ncbi:MAG: FAD-binding oxidoreductase [Candidatus Latescibacter sp.]|nr:FAD-binding oxidoreductase [Candidatus Latescibacter sp.]
MNDNLYTRFEQRFGSEYIDLSANPPVIVPRDENLLAEIVRFLSAEKTGGVTVRGGGTYADSIPGNGTVLLSLSRMDRVKEVNPGDFLIVAQAGAVVDEAVGAGVRSGLLLPLDITSGKESTLGGAYMTAAVGPYAAGYGDFRDYVIGAKCITAKGDAVTFGGRTTKNVTGYEITRFLAGTRGLFAIAVELTLKVLPLPEVRTMVAARFSKCENLTKAINAVHNLGFAVKRFELTAENGLKGEILAGVGIEGMEPLVKREIQAAEKILFESGADSVHEEQPEIFMEKRRAIALNLAGEGLVTISIPPSASGSILGTLRREFPEAPLFGHPLIGRFHLLLRGEQPVLRLNNKVLAVGGNIPAVWGHAAREGLSSLLTPAERVVAIALKKELDPKGMLNPGLRL